MLPDGTLRRTTATATSFVTSEPMPEVQVDRFHVIASVQTLAMACPEFVRAAGQFRNIITDVSGQSSPSPQLHVCHLQAPS